MIRLEQLIAEPKWRPVLSELLEMHPSCLMLQFAHGLHSEGGHAGLQINWERGDVPAVLHLCII